MIPIGRWENSGFRQQINVRRDALRCAAPRYASTLRTAEQRFRIAPDTARGGGVVHRIQVDAVHVVGHEVGDLLGSVEDAGGTQGLDVVPPLVQQGVELVRDARGVALGHATHGLGATHRHDARLDRHGDAGGARLVEEAVEVLIVVEELGNQVSDAGINLDFEVFDVLVQRVSLIVASG